MSFASCPMASVETSESGLELNLTTATQRGNEKPKASTAYQTAILVGTGPSAGQPRPVSQLASYFLLFSGGPLSLSAVLPLFFFLLPSLSFPALSRLLIHQQLRPASSFIHFNVRKHRGEDDTRHSVHFPSLSLPISMTRRNKQRRRGASCRRVSQTNAPCTGHTQSDRTRPSQGVRSDSNTLPTPDSN